MPTSSSLLESDSNESNDKDAYIFLKKMWQLRQEIQYSLWNKIKVEVKVSNQTLVRQWSANNIWNLDTFEKLEEKKECFIKS